MSFHNNFVGIHGKCNWTKYRLLPPFDWNFSNGCIRKRKEVAGGVKCVGT